MADTARFMTWEAWLPYCNMLKSFLKLSFSSSYDDQLACFEMVVKIHHSSLVLGVRHHVLPLKSSTPLSCPSHL